MGYFYIYPASEKAYAIRNFLDNLPVVQELQTISLNTWHRETLLEQHLREEHEHELDRLMLPQSLAYIREMLEIQCLVRLQDLPDAVVRSSDATSGNLPMKAPAPLKSPQKGAALPLLEGGSYAEVELRMLAHYFDNPLRGHALIQTSTMDGVEISPTGRILKGKY